MTIILYDLCGADGRRFSPNCWRTRMALAHKGLDHESRATLFTGIGAIAPGARRTLPTIDDGGRLVTDSWAIANHLEETYPDRPSLFGGAAGRSLTLFVQNWADNILHPGLIGFAVHDIYRHLSPEDQAYFRETREKRFGKPLEGVQTGREDRLDAFRKNLAPLRRTVEMQPFLGGQGPLYADYLAFGGFQWLRSVSDFQVLAEDDPIAAWFERCLDLHDGLGRKAPGYWMNAAA